VNALSAKLLALDAKLKGVAPERYALWLLIPSAILLLTLCPAAFFWGIDASFRPTLYPQATIVWAVSLPLAFLSYEGLLAAWRSRFSFPRKLSFTAFHLAAIILALSPIYVFAVMVWAIGGFDGNS
jgi:hypothetical protein